MMRLELYIFLFMMAIFVVQVLSFSENDPYCSASDTICVDDSGLDGHHAHLNQAIGNVSKGSGILKIFVGKDIYLSAEGDKVLWIGRTIDQAEGNETHPIIISPHPFNGTLKIDCGNLSLSALSETNIIRNGRNLKSYFLIGKRYWKISGFHFICNEFSTGNSLSYIVVGTESKGKVTIEDMTFGESLGTRGYHGVHIIEDSGNITSVKEFFGTQVKNCNFINFHHAIVVQFGKGGELLDPELDYFNAEDEYKIEISHCKFSKISHSSRSSSALRMNDHVGEGMDFIGIGVNFHDNILSEDCVRMVFGNYVVRTKIENNVFEESNSQYSKGIVVASASDVIIRNNTLGVLNRGIEIFKVYPSSTVEITENKISGVPIFGTDTVGIYLSQISSTDGYTYINDNIINNMTYAIKSNKGTMFKATRNKFINCERPLQFSYSNPAPRSDILFYNNTFTGIKIKLMVCDNADIQFYDNTVDSLASIQLIRSRMFNFSGNFLINYDSYFIDLRKEEDVGSSFTMGDNNTFYGSNGTESRNLISIDKSNFTISGKNNVMTGIGGIYLSDLNKFDLGTLIDGLDSLEMSKDVSVTSKDVKELIIQDVDLPGGIEAENTNLIIQNSKIELEKSGILLTSSSLFLDRSYIFSRNKLGFNFSSSSIISFQLTENSSIVAMIQNSIFDFRKDEIDVPVILLTRENNINVFNTSFIIQNNQFMMENKYKNEIVSISAVDVSVYNMTNQFMFINNLVDVKSKDKNYNVISFNKNENLCGSEDYCKVSYNYFFYDYSILSSYIDSDLKIENNMFEGSMNFSYYKLNEGLCEDEELTDLPFPCYSLGVKICGKFVDGVSPFYDYNGEIRNNDSLISVGSFERGEDVNCSVLSNYTICSEGFYGEPLCETYQCFSIFSNETVEFMKVCNNHSCGIGDICNCEPPWFGERCNLTWNGTWAFLLGLDDVEREACPAIDQTGTGIRINRFYEFNNFCYQYPSNSTLMKIINSTHSIAKGYKGKNCISSNYLSDKDTIINFSKNNQQDFNFSVPTFRKSKDFSPARKNYENLVNKFLTVRLYDKNSDDQMSCSSKDEDELRLFPMDECLFFANHGYIKFTFLYPTDCGNITILNFTDSKCSGNCSTTTRSIRIGECLPYFFDDEFTSRFGYIVEEDFCFPGLFEDEVLSDQCFQKCVEKCFGIPYNDKDVCNGNGNCRYEDSCECDPDYYGENCNITSCFGFFSNETEKVCSENGICVSPNNCECEEFYHGQECNFTECFSIPSNEDSSCGVHGSCIDINICDCLQNYYGIFCNISTCFNQFSNDTSSCGTHGSCSSFDHCDCEENYYGEYCNVTKCFGKLSNETESCNGEDHGICISSDTCICSISSKWFGRECNITYCHGIWNNETTINKVCSEHGDCIFHNLCKCNPNYYGEYCNETLCFGKWNNETNNNNVCDGHGFCKEFNTCDCDGWFGEICNITSCYGILSNESEVCGGKGICESPNYCKCKNDYFGDSCNVTICNGIFSNNSLSCGINGDCEDFDVCKCKQNYYGDCCNITICHGVLSNETISCLNGTCLGFDNCDCGIFNQSLTIDCKPLQNSNNEGGDNSSDEDKKDGSGQLFVVLGSIFGSLFGVFMVAALILCLFVGFGILLSICLLICCVFVVISTVIGFRRSVKTVVPVIGEIEESLDDDEDDDESSSQEESDEENDESSEGSAEGSSEYSSTDSSSDSNSV